MPPGCNLSAPPCSRRDPPVSLPGTVGAPALPPLMPELLTAGNLPNQPRVIYAVPTYGHKSTGPGVEARKYRAADPRPPRGTGSPRIRPRPPDRGAIGRRDSVSRRFLVPDALPD